MKLIKVNDEVHDHNTCVYTSACLITHNNIILPTNEMYVQAFETLSSKHMTCLKCP